MFQRRALLSPLLSPWGARASPCSGAAGHWEGMPASASYLLLPLHGSPNRTFLPTPCFHSCRSDPAAERIIGERAPFETDARRMSQWLPQAVQVGPAMLAQAASDDAELLHVLSIGHVPESK